MAGTFTSGSLNAKNFGKGGGGSLTGVKHNCRLTGFAVVEHALVRKDKKTEAIIEKYPTNCFLKYEINVLDPVEDGEPAHGEQFAQIGNLPLWRLSQLNEPPDAKRNLKYPGGYLPSKDNETPTSTTAELGSGPFVVFDGVSDIYEGAEGSLFLAELQSLAGAAGFEDQYLERLDKMGVAAFDGIEVMLDTKTKPKGKKAAADPAAKDRSVIVAVRVNKWPWESGVQTTASAAAAANAPSVPVVAGAFPAAVPTPAVVPSAAAPLAAQPQPAVAPPAAAPAAGALDYDALTIERIKLVARENSNMVPAAELLTKIWALVQKDTTIDAPTRMQVMQRVNNPQWVKGAADAGHFLQDASGMIMVVG